MKKISDGLADIIVLVLIGVGAGDILFSIFPSLKSEIAAAWIQAIGSIIAIVVAFLISRLQYKNDLKRDELNERRATKRMIQSLGLELEIARENLRQSVFYDKGEPPPGSYIDGMFYQSSQNHPIYSAHIHEIGNISDEQARRSLIETYGHMESLQLAMTAHNQALSEFRFSIAYLINHPEFERSNLNKNAKYKICEMSRRLYFLYHSIDGEIENLLPLLDRCQRKIPE